jgi:hypothetical protein
LPPEVLYANQNQRPHNHKAFAWANAVRYVTADNRDAPTPAFAWSRVVRLKRFATDDDAASEKLPLFSVHL